jgi:ubiquitin-like protein Pup
MTQQAKVRAPRPIRRTGTEVHEDSRTQRERERGQARRAEIERGIDDLLEEVDDLLEENAEEFLKGYVQKGGE